MKEEGLRTAGLSPIIFGATTLSWTALAKGSYLRKPYFRSTAAGMWGGCCPYSTYNSYN